MSTFSRRNSLFLLFATLVWSIEPTAACSCAGGRVFPLDAAAGSDLVFVGKVSQILSNEHSSQREYVFDPTEIFVGDPDATQFRLHGDVGSSCNVGFQAGETYLVYAHSRTPEEGFSTHDCTRTRHAKSADLDLLLLRGNPLPEIPIRLDIDVYDGHVSLSVYGGYGRRWTIESSRDLSEWKILEEFNGQFEGGLLFFLGHSPDEGGEYYRVKETGDSSASQSN